MSSSTSANPSTESASAGEHLDPQSCRLVAEFFSSLANPTRVSMFCAMREGKKTVSEIAEAANVTLQNASQHLRVMRDKGAVIAERDGQHVLYAIADQRLIEGSRLIRDVLAEQLQQRAGSVNGLTIGGQPRPESREE